MATTFRLILSDGTTTVPLFSGTDAILAKSGLSMPPPEVRSSLITSSLYDGARLGASTYGSRSITARIHIMGTSSTDLQTNVRTIQKLLNDARERALAGYGAQTYLEIQWGDVGGASTFFDILRGDLVMPPNYLQHARRDGYIIIAARLELVCKPFGRRANVDISQATIDNGQGTKDFCTDGYQSQDSEALLDTAMELLVDGTNELGFNFTAGEAFTVKYVGILGMNWDAVGAGTTITCELFAVDGGGHPAGGALAVDTLDLTEWLDYLAVDANMERNSAKFVWFTFGTPYALGNGTKYAVTFSSDGDGAHEFAIPGVAVGAMPAGSVGLFYNGAVWGNSTVEIEFAIAKDKATNDTNYQDIGIDNLLLNGGFEIGDPPDDWVLAGAAATVVQSTTQVQIGTYSAKLTRNGADCSIAGAVSTFADYQGETMTLGGWVWASVASRGFLRITDGVSLDNSSFHSGGSSWEWLTVTYTVNGAATELKGRGHISTGNTDVYFDGLVLVKGSSIPEGSEPYGDVPAKMYWKLNPTASGKMWLAKRSGSRQEDALWLEGEAYDSYTDVVGGQDVINETVRFNSGASDGLTIGLAQQDAGNIAADTLIGYFQWDIATLPKGQFRVLARCKAYSEGGSACTFDEMKFGVGWEYGAHTKQPSLANGDFFACTAEDLLEILDLGVHRIPPVSDSEIATANTFSLRIYLLNDDTATANNYHHWYIDWIFLLPVDEGVVIVDSIGATKDLTTDTISDPPQVVILDSGKVDEIPDRTGGPFDLGRQSTRLYVVQNTDADATFLSDVKYQPQQLVV